MTEPDPTPAAGTRGTVLVTGTSSGIGLATAVAAARAGWTTVATLRNPDRAGPMALRLSASAAGGVSLRQEVVAAYALR